MTRSSKPWKILVCGSRTWDDVSRLTEVISGTCRKDDLIIHGDAKGADSQAGYIARGLGIHEVKVPALWNNYGKSAGYKRNAAMLKLDPDIVLAFWDGVSPGTKMMLDLADKAGIPVEVYTAEHS